VDLGRGLIDYLTDLKSVGFISFSTPFHKNKNSRLLKYRLSDVVQDVERKVNILQSKFKQKTIQKILISLSPPTKDLTATGYFFKVIHPESFLN
jgi:hypothetical protein